MALMVFLVMGMSALAIDYGMIKAAGGEAQRAADAAALAGASAYLDEPILVDSAYARANRYVSRHTIRNVQIDTLTEVVVTPVLADQTVEVRVTRAGLITWFASTFGVPTLDVSKRAVAEAGLASSISACLMPFAIPDIWRENVDDTYIQNQVQEHPITRGPPSNQQPGEYWSFDPVTDYYERYDPTNPTTTQTGYGSGWRDSNGDGITADRGREILLKPQRPEDTWGPGNFNFWTFNTPEGGVGDADQELLRARVRGDCGDDPGIQFGVSNATVVPGNRVNIDEPLLERINADPNAEWDPVSRTIVNSNHADWRQSPRVVHIALYDPHLIASLGDRAPIAFNNVALFFLETIQAGEVPGRQDNILGRFLWYASGGTAGGQSATLVKTLRLIK
jgi:hypothetical protein